MTVSLRPELGELPTRLKKLPLDERGYPVPWFVAYVDGKPEFRAMDAKKWAYAVRDRLCWVCGEKLGANISFLIGPMCGINRTTAEPGSHRECAQWSARNCPFLTRPKMVRREDDIINDEKLVSSAPGIALTRNPGVALVWTTRSFKVFNAGGDGNSGQLIALGDPESVEFYAEGRPATREEILASVDSGYPALLEVAERQDREEHCGSVAELGRYRERFELLLPA